MRARGGGVTFLLVLDPVVASGHLPQYLADDADRLAHLVEADGVAVEVVAVGPDDHVEANLVVGKVGLGASQVLRHAGRAQDRPGGRQGDRFFGADRPHAFGAGPEDGLAGEQVAVVVGAQMTATSSSQPSGSSAAVPRGG